MTYVNVRHSVGNNVYCVLDIFDWAFWRDGKLAKKYCFSRSINGFFLIENFIFDLHECHATQPLRIHKQGNHCSNVYHCDCNRPHVHSTCSGAKRPDNRY